jgi:TatD DNase family protein
VVETAKTVAAARGVSFDDIARQTTENFFRLFNKVPPPRSSRQAGESRVAVSTA